MDKRQTIKTAAIGLLAGVFASRSGAANETQTGASDRFPGDPPEHRLVYQVNHAQADYIDHIINSLRAMIVKYGDNVALAVVAFGPGLHLLATQYTVVEPGRGTWDRKIQFIESQNDSKFWDQEN